MADDRAHDADKRSEHASRRTGDQRSADSGERPALHPLLQLQRQVGNASVARLLAQRQTEVMRQEEAEEEEEGAEELQLKRATPEVGLEGGPLSEDLSKRIQLRRGSGSPLADNVRGKMEGAFGTSLEDVRVHTDGESGDLNRSVGARAFTTGSDVFFGEGASPTDHKLLAHELTHVVQQRGTSGGGPTRVGPADDSLERQADSVASAVAAGTVAQRSTEED